MRGLTKGVMLALAMATVAVAALPERSEARTRPQTKWCLRGPTGSNACLYNTFEQCRLAASGTGGSCMRNPRYGRR